jgi:serine/threonine-protein kinase RsbW
MSPLSEAWRLRRTLRPALSDVDAVCAIVRNRLKQTAIDADCFAVELLLREALINAVTHGCRGRATGRVRCEIRRTTGSIRIVVTDDGDGFDWRLRQEVAPAEEDTSGRGICLYDLYADRVMFNEAGNRVALSRTLRDPQQGDRP